MRNCLFFTIGYIKKYPDAKIHYQNELIKLFFQNIIFLHKKSYRVYLRYLISKIFSLSIIGHFYVTHNGQEVHGRNGTVVFNRIINVEDLPCLEDTQPEFMYKQNPTYNLYKLKDNHPKNLI